MNINKDYILILSGIIWGLTGFTIEVIPPGAESLQVLIRLVLILISSVLGLYSLEVKISKDYYLGISFMFFYVFIFIFVNFLYNISLIDILRELFLFVIVIILFILLSNENKIFIFLKGIYFSLVLLVLFYILSINFSQLLQPFYRLFTGLNSNGIGIIAVMTFILSYYSFFKENLSSKIFLNKNNIFLIVSLLSIIVIIATKSRTALGLLFIAFLVININFKNIRILLVTLLISIIIIITQYEVIEAVLRLKNADGYRGGNSIYNLTGRTEIWSRAILIIENNFLLGVGSSDAWTIADGHKATFHNAYLQNFVTVGFIGTMPLLYLILVSLKNLIFKRDYFIFKTIFLVGFTSTFVESKFFNYGSPGNLLFLISLLYLSRNHKNKEKDLKYD